MGPLGPVVFAGHGRPLCGMPPFRLSAPSLPGTGAQPAHIASAAGAHGALLLMQGSPWGPKAAPTSPEFQALRQRECLTLFCVTVFTINFNFYF